MAVNKEKSSANEPELSLKTSATLVITTASLTYIVLNTLFIAPLKEERESLRRERDSLLSICRECLRQQAQTSGTLPVRDTTRRSPAREKMLRTVTTLIEMGQKIREMPLTEQQSEAAFSDWRARSVAFLSSLDQQVGSHFEAQFAALTEFEPATYQLMPQSTADGLLVLQAAKGKITNPKR
jgi:hypothetical protein